MIDTEKLSIFHTMTCESNLALVLFRVDIYTIMPHSLHIDQAERLKELIEVDKAVLVYVHAPTNVQNVVLWVV